MPNVNRVAVAFTSKEIAFCNLGIKMDLFCPIKLCDITDIPTSLNHWYKPDNPNEALLVWGDTRGYLNILFWAYATMALFEKPTNLSKQKEESTFSVSLNDVIQKKSKFVSFLRLCVHTDWVRKVMYIPQLEAFITCSTVWNNSMIVTWLEKLPTNDTLGRNRNILFVMTLRKVYYSTLLNFNRCCEPRALSRRSVFAIHKGINDFDFHEGNNQIATAGVNYHVCLWNPYVVSKPNGVRFTQIFVFQQVH
ncbi:unnamed protein product [Heterobilharzia americana]|nr:unnamed protein product [Heterobilharzia americana]